MTVYAGQRIRAGDIPFVLFRNKAGAETVSGTSSQQDDDDLFVTLTPGLYRIEVLLTVTGVADGSGDIDVTYSNTGTMSFLSRHPLGPQAGSTDPENTAVYLRARGISDEIRYGLASTSQAATIREQITVEVTVTGVLRLRWSQSVGNATATSLSTSSHMIVTPLTEF